MAQDAHGAIWLVGDWGWQQWFELSDQLLLSSLQQGLTVLKTGEFVLRFGE